MSIPGGAEGAELRDLWEAEGVAILGLLWDGVIEVLGYHVVWVMLASKGLK